MSASSGCGSVVTDVRVCMRACDWGEGHDKDLHLVIIAGCVISANCLRTDSAYVVHEFCVLDNGD